MARKSVPPEASIGEAHPSGHPTWLLFKLDRPQYPPSPDILQTALAWSLFPGASSASDPLVYRRRHEAGPSRRLTIRQTRPDLDPVLAERWKQLVRKEGYPPTAAELVLDAIEGMTTEGKPVVSPLSPALALLQNPSGVMGVGRPPNFANIIETFMAAGDAKPDGPRRAASLWYQASRDRCSRMPLIRWIDNSIEDLVVKGMVDHQANWPPPLSALSAEREVIHLPPWWSPGVAARTPFGWFARAWPRLCEAGWNQVLPPRRWVDWASAILRTGLAFGYLWEANFYRALGRAVLRTRAGEEGQAGRAEKEILFEGEPLLPWETVAGLDARNVHFKLRAILRSGLRCRQIISDRLEGVADSPAPRTLPGAIQVVLDELEGDAPAAKELEGAFSPGAEPPGFNNLWEFVRYSLQARRKESGEQDPYGFLRSAGQKTTVIDPGPEWLVVLAAMAAHRPGDPCRLSDILLDLASLGLRPRFSAVIAELKRAGLCEGSPDADEGILVHSPFPRAEEPAR